MTYYIEFLGVFLFVAIVAFYVTFGKSPKWDDEEREEK